MIGVMGRKTRGPACGECGPRHAVQVYALTLMPERLATDAGPEVRWPVWLACVSCEPEAALELLASL